MADTPQEMADILLLNGILVEYPDGKVTICEQLFWNKKFIIGDVNTSSLTQIWNSPQSLQLAYMKKEFIDSTSKCKSCRIFKKCFDNRNRCWTDIIKAYGDEHWDYPDPRCKWAPKMIHALNL